MDDAYKQGRASGSAIMDDRCNGGDVNGKYVFFFGGYDGTNA